MGVMGAEKQAEALKQQGNTYFSKEKLGAAIEAYTEAITLCPNVPVYWTNRALCFKKRSEWSKVAVDCRRALELDSSSVKARYLLGLALLHEKDYNRAVYELDRALDFARGGNGGPRMVEEIWQELSQAKYTQWEAESAGRRHKAALLQEHCQALLREDHTRTVERIKAAKSASTSGQEDHPMADSEKSKSNRRSRSRTRFNPDRSSDMEPPDSPMAEDHPPRGEGALGGEEESKGEGVEDSDKARRVAEEVSRLDEEYRERLEELNRTFEKAGAADIPSEVPDYLCCKLTMEIFRDPVITTSGITYERQVLLEHLRKVGKFDPVTRAALEEKDLVPNVAIKAAVQSYLAEHGWAYRLT